MPFVRGESLRARLERERQLPVDDALDITRAVGDALTYAHALGVVHRDIKPDNILLSGNQARVADFGIARALSEVHGGTLTGTGIVVGSPAYMSPEQAAGERELDGRSDVYALGCVLYEMLAGQPPFSGPTQESLLRQHLITPPPDVTQLRPLAPPQVAVALARAMAKAPADRFQTSAQFVAALRTLPTSDASTTARAVSTTLRGTHRIAWVVGAAVVVASAVGVWFTLRSSTSDRASDRPLIAVLPFRNIGAADDEYFADGLTEEITSRLSTISSIGTISRTTSMSYKGSTKPPLIFLCSINTTTQLNDETEHSFYYHVINGNGFVTEEGIWQSFNADGKLFDDGQFPVLWKKTSIGWKMYRDAFSSNRQ